MQRRQCWQVIEVVFMNPMNPGRFSLVFECRFLLRYLFKCFKPCYITCGYCRLGYAQVEGGYLPEVGLVIMLAA